MSKATKSTTDDEKEHQDVASSSASVAAAATVERNDDDSLTLGEMYQTADSLSNMFGFDFEICLRAIQELETTDITLLYNLILEKGWGKDQGGPIVPIDTCPHLSLSPLLSLNQLPSTLFRTPCGYIQNNDNKGRLKSDDDDTPPIICKTTPTTTFSTIQGCNGMENWLCLTCGVVRCSRYVNEHAMEHYRSSQHHIAVSLSDLSVWCYTCQAYLKHKTLIDPLVQQLQNFKFSKPDDDDDETKNDDQTNNNIKNNQTKSESNDTKNNNQNSNNNKDENKNNDTSSSKASGTKEQEMSEKRNPCDSHEQEKEDDLYTGAEKKQKLTHHGNTSPPYDENNNNNVVQEEDDDDDDEDGDSSTSENSNDDSTSENNSSDSDDSTGENNDNNNHRNDGDTSTSSSDNGFDPLLSLFRNNTDDDDENVSSPSIDYPFGSCPNSLKEVAAFIQSPQCRSIVILAGAGMSVASGIPDFRSSGGLYDSIRPERLTATTLERAAITSDPTFALDHHIFLQNPLPCLEVNRRFILGTAAREWKATLAHFFCECLHTKTGGKLTRLYQQNIDGLEGQCTGLPREKIVYVHGSMDEAECATCRAPYDYKTFCDKIRDEIKDVTVEADDDEQELTVSNQDEEEDENAVQQQQQQQKSSRGITCLSCGANTVKPRIVLFRSPLPKIFFESIAKDLPEADLLFVIGTSLAVAPANSCVYRVPPTALRVVLNREPVGFRLGIDYTESPTRDFFARGDIESTILQLFVELNWMDELRTILPKLPESSARLVRNLGIQEEEEDECDPSQSLQQQATDMKNNNNNIEQETK